MSGAEHPASASADAVADTERTPAQPAEPLQPSRAWHVMLDLETLSTAKDAAVFQIAALCFDPDTGETGPAFCEFINQPSGRIDASTVFWWMQQKAAAYVGGKLSVCSAAEPEEDRLQQFAEWFRGLNAVALWSHGATFDIVVLENAYARSEWCAGKPWSYKIERDTRTLYALAYADGKPPAVPTDDTRKHDAAYDCEIQAQQVTLAWRKLRHAEQLADCAADYFEDNDTGSDSLDWALTEYRGTPDPV